MKKFLCLGRGHSIAGPGGKGYQLPGKRSVQACEGSWPPGFACEAGW